MFFSLCFLCITFQKCLLCILLRPCVLNEYPSRTLQRNQFKESLELKLVIPYVTHFNYTFCMMNLHVESFLVLI